MNINGLKSHPAGYKYLITKFNLREVPNRHISNVLISGTQKHIITGKITEEFYPSQYWPGEKNCDHLEFAIKYDGINLSLLSLIFKYISQKELTEYILSKPTGKYTRRIWFFYEFLTGNNLPVDDLSSGNYVEALNEKEYFTIKNGEKSKRHRITNNLIGPKYFCPVIKKTKTLLKLNSSDIKKKCTELVTSYSPSLIRRALSFLYNKETKSSFEIEHVKPNASRTEKFIKLLELAENEDFITKEKLIELQNQIVDSRFMDNDYRIIQNYVGQTISFQKEYIHYICPKPSDLPDLMQGLIDCHIRLKNSDIDPVIHAAIISYGFVFLHPFEDGNGRIHRFLIHNILSLHKVIPHGIMFPVSAVMLKNQEDYDSSLEAFSKPLLKVIDYKLSKEGEMNVHNETADWYKYIDMTNQAESLDKFIFKTIDEELKEELNFLANYDKTKRAIQDIIDMPDRLISLFIQLCLQNNGELSAKKRASHFDFLTDDELTAMNKAVKSINL